MITLLGVNAGDFAAAGYKGVLAGPVGIAGTSGNDVLVGTSSADDFFGGAGADTFLYRASSDSTPSAYDVITDFQTGQDVIDLTAVHASSVSLVRSGSATFLFAETPTGPMTIAADGPINGNDVVTGGTNHGGIYLVGDDDGDMLTGSAQGDAIQGGAYDDLITGGGGGDVLTGGGGANTFAYQAASDSTASAPDFITDFQSGQDKIDLTVVPVSHISTIDDGAATFVFVETSQGEMQINVQGAVEAGDILTTGLINFYEIGDSDNNTLIGGAGNDVLQGGSGNETLIGGGASDALFGGPGADTFTYLAASDSNAGGFDTIFDFQTGIDKIDLAAVNPTHVSVLVDGAAEFLFINVPGAAMEIAVVGSVQAADVITGSSTTPFYIVGDDNAHTLIGGGGPDVIAGGAGNDIIIGGGGTDALYGGAGKDTFKYLAASDSTTSTPDTIFDFQTGIDKIDLSAIHTSSKDVINILVSGNASYLYIDQGGDGVNDMLIQIANPNLHATDIVW